jgi:hypothetical protein
MNPKAPKDEYGQIVSCLLSISKLEFDASDAKFMHDVSRVNDIEKLAKARMIPTVEEFRKRFPKFLTRELERICKEFGRNEPIIVTDDSPFDLLGAYYFNGDRTAVVYDLNCLLAACKLNLNYDALKEIVAAHEIAHAMTHLGKYDSTTWKNYVKSEKGKHELFAQAYAWFYSKGDSDLEDVMRRLSENQPAPYRLWEHFLDDSPERINGILKLEMLGSNEATEIRRVLGKVPGRKVEYGLLWELIKYKSNLLEDVREKKVASRRMLIDMKESIDLLQEVVFRDYPQHRISGIRDPDIERMGLHLSVFIDSNLVNELRGIEYAIRNGDIKEVE